MHLGDLLAGAALQLAEALSPVLAALGIGYLRQALARIRDERWRQLAWEAMVYAERRFATGPERLEYVTNYLAKRTGLPASRLRHLIESLVAQVERELQRPPAPAARASR